MSYIPIIYHSNILYYLDLHGIKPADYIIFNYYLCLGVILLLLYMCGVLASA